jgi:opacity protein-like surface antigen
MRMLKAAFALAAACAVVLIGILPVAPAEDTVYYTISGKVLEAGTGKAVSGAQVTVGTKTMVSDDSGFFRLDMLAGDYTIGVTADGYWNYSGNITLSGNITKDLELKKKPDTGACGVIWMALAIPLSAVAVAGWRGRTRSQI